MTKNIKIIIAIAVVVGLALLYSSMQDSGLLSYRSEKVGFSFTYPRSFVLEEIDAKGDPQQSVIITLTDSGKGILVVPSIRPTVEIEQEKSFYENLLFGNPEQTTNYRVELDQGVNGFRSKIPNIDRSLYTIYRGVDENNSLTIRSELNASSTALLVEAEEEFVSIVKSIVFNQDEKPL